MVSNHGAPASSSSQGASAAAAAADALALDLGGEEALEGLAELRPPPRRGVSDLQHLQLQSGMMRRGTSVAWWESSTAGTAETNSDPETFIEHDPYALDSEDTSVSSTRASTSATGTTGSASRLGRAATRGFSAVGVRGERSPHSLAARLLRGAAPHGYRGRSVTRRGGRTPGAAMRHRRPTHTPSRSGRDTAAADLPMDLDTPGRLRLPAPRSHQGRASGSMSSLRLGYVHTFGHLYEEPAELPEAEVVPR